MIDEPADDAALDRPTGSPVARVVVALALSVAVGAGGFLLGRASTERFDTADWVHERVDAGCLPSVQFIIGDGDGAAMLTASERFVESRRSEGADNITTKISQLSDGRMLGVGVSEDCR